MVLWVMPWLQVSGTPGISRVTKAGKSTMVAEQQGACYQGPRDSAKRADIEPSEAWPQESNQEGPPAGSGRGAAADAQ